MNPWFERAKKPQKMKARRTVPKSTRSPRSFWSHKGPAPFTLFEGLCRPFRCAPWLMAKVTTTTTLGVDGMSVNVIFSSGTFAPGIFDEFCI